MPIKPSPRHMDRQAPIPSTVDDYVGVIGQALDDMSYRCRQAILDSLPAREYDLLVGYIGAIRAAHDGLCGLLDAIDDDCPPHGIVRPTIDEALGFHINEALRKVVACDPNYVEPF